MSHLAGEEIITTEFCLLLQAFTCHQSTKGDEAVEEQLSTPIPCPFQTIITYSWRKKKKKVLNFVLQAPPINYFTLKCIKNILKRVFLILHFEERNVFLVLKVFIFIKLSSNSRKTCKRFFNFEKLPSLTRKPTFSSSTPNMSKRENEHAM